MFRDPQRDIAFPVVGSILLFGLLVGGGLLYSGFGGDSRDSLVTAMLIDAIMVVGLQIYIGNTGVLSFGHIGFGAIAGYTFAVLAIAPERKSTVIRNAPFGLNEVELSPTAATLVAIGVTLVVAVIVGLGLARSGAKSGAVSATVITLALLFVTHEVAVNWTDLTGGDRAGLSFSIGDTLDSRLPIFVILFGAILVARLFAQSRAGKLAHAAREDNLAARAMGVDPAVQQMAALLISVIVVAVAASIRVYEIGNITPKFFFFDYTLLTLVMLIVGGRRSVTGAIAGVVMITIGREITRTLGGPDIDVPGLNWILKEGLTNIFLGCAMLGFMIFRADGVLDDWEIDNWLFRRFRREPTASPEPLEAVPESEPVELTAQDLSVDFGGFRALNQASISARSNEVVGLIGPNGAGKTTLVNAITGMVETSEGSYALASTPLTGEPSHRIARAGLVRTFQNLRLFSSLTVRENVEISSLVAQSHRADRTQPDVDRLIAQAGLWEHRHRRARELDYGNSRRLELARAAAMAPTFLLLDEPTSGMNSAESVAMIEQVRSMAAAVGAGVLVIDHDLAFITGIADRIYCLDQGTILAEGTPQEIQDDEAVQAAYLGSASPV